MNLGYGPCMHGEHLLDVQVRGCGDPKGMWILCPSSSLADKSMTKSLGTRLDHIMWLMY